jgi:hypothetical protein
MMNKSGLLFISIISIPLLIVFSCSPLTLPNTAAEKTPAETIPAEEEPEGTVSADGSEDPSNSGGMLLSISGPTSDEIEKDELMQLNYYQLIAVNKDAPTPKVAEQVRSWRYHIDDSPKLSLSIPLIKNNTYYLLLLGGNDDGGTAPTLMVSGFTTITVPGQSFTLNIPMKAMVVGTEFIAADDTIYEQGRLQKTVGLYENSPYTVRVTLGSGQNDQKVTGNGISPLIEAQKAADPTSGSALSLVSKSGFYKNVTQTTTIEAISAIANNSEVSPQVYDYTLSNTGAKSNDAYSFHFNMQYRPFGFPTGDTWVIRNGLNDDVQTVGEPDDPNPGDKYTYNTDDPINNGMRTFGSGGNYNGAIPIAVVEPVETRAPGLYEGNNPAPIDWTEVDFGSTTTLQIILQFLSNNGTQAQYGSYTIVLGAKQTGHSVEGLPSKIELGGTEPNVDTGSDPWQFGGIVNTTLTFADASGTNIWGAESFIQHSNRVIMGNKNGAVTVAGVDTVPVSELPTITLGNATAGTTGNMLGLWKYDAASKVYTILNKAAVRVVDSTTERRIEIAAGAKPTVTLDGATINPTSGAPILLKTGSDLTLNLKDSSTNTVTGGAQCAGIQTTLGTLTIGPETSTGKLIAAGGGKGTGSYGGAGIGGGANGAGGNINILGGRVKATGGNIGNTSGGGAGIGGGGGVGTGDGVLINILGGVVAATGGPRAAGIGGGGGGSAGGDGGEINILGGAVLAIGSPDSGIGGAGIGGGGGSGAGGAGGDITISGNAIVMARGYVQAAGIGGGSGKSASEITISGTSTVVAIAGGYVDGGNSTFTPNSIGAGSKGGSSSGDTSTITITGSCTVIADKNIGGLYTYAYSPPIALPTVNIDGGVVFAGSITGSSTIAGTLNGGWSFPSSGNAGSGSVNWSVTPGTATLPNGWSSTNGGTITVRTWPTASDWP